MSEIQKPARQIPNYGFYANRLICMKLTPIGNKLCNLHWLEWKRIF